MASVTKPAKAPGDVQAATQKSSGRRRQVSEHYQALLRRLELSKDGMPSTLGITSCRRREGVSTVATNLAVAAAQLRSSRVLLVDANFAHPWVSRKFGVLSQHGLGTALLGGTPFDCVHDSRIENLSLMPAGASGWPAYDAKSIDELLDNLKHVFELIVFDLPPANELTTCFSMAARLDGVLMVVEGEATDRRLAARAARQLSQINAQLLGAVYNKWRKRFLGMQP